MNKLDSNPTPGEDRSVFLDFSTMFAYRGVWMFLAILCIILYHAPGTLPSSWNVLKNYIYGGVDVFLFSSGIGCAWSLNQDPDILRFLKRRARRILPMYLLSLLFWLGFCYRTANLTGTQAIGNLFGHGILAGVENQFNWYFGCSWLCYFLTPFFLALAKAYPGQLPRFLITGALAILSLTFCGQYQLLLWSRIPIYFHGVCLLETSTRKKGLTLGELGMLLLLMVLGAAGLGLVFRYYSQWLWNGGLYWYPFILITPGMCCLISLAASRLSGTPLKFLVSLCQRGSRHTLSLCLTHVLVFAEYRDLLARGRFQESTFSICCALFLSVATALLLEKTEQLLFFLWKRIKRS